MLNIVQLSVTASQQTILHNLDLIIKPGEMHVLMGPNGSGKSTLCHTLMGHPAYTVAAGSLQWLDCDLIGMKPEERARAGLFLAWQHPAEIPGVNVLQLMRAALRERGSNYTPKEFLAMAEAGAGALGLSDELLRRPLHEHASGGEKKRLEMLQLMLLKPRLALLDEIDSGVDVDALRLLAQVIRQRAAEDKTAFLIVTHYQRLLQYITPDRVHIMKEGRIVMSGGPELVEAVERDGYGAFSSINQEKKLIKQEINKTKYN